MRSHPGDVSRIGNESGRRVNVVIRALQHQTGRRRILIEDRGIVVGRRFHGATEIRIPGDEQRRAGGLRAIVEAARRANERGCDVTGISAVCFFPLYVAIEAAVVNGDDVVRI